MKLNRDFSWMILLILVIAVIIVLVGGISVLTDDQTFQQYLDSLEKFALAVGIFGAGRAVKNGLRHRR